MSVFRKTGRESRARSGAAVLAGGFAGGLANQLVEVMQIGDARFDGDGFDGERGMHEQMTRPFQPLALDVFPRAATQMPQKQMGQMVVRDAHGPGDSTHADVFRQSIADDAQGDLQAGMHPLI